MEAFDHGRNIEYLIAIGIDFNKAPPKEDIRHFHNHFMSSQEKQTNLLYQFQALEEKAKSEIKNMPSHRGKILGRNTVELFKNMCERFGLGSHHIIRLRALEIYYRFMSLRNEEIMLTARSHKYSPEVFTKNIFSIGGGQTLLTICSCIQLAYKFHNDVQHELVKILKAVKHRAENRKSHILSIKDIQKELRQFFLHYSSEAIKMSEIRVYKMIKYKLNFVTALDLIEHIIPLTTNHFEEMPKIYHLCIKLLDFSYLSHDKIYERVKDQNIFIGNTQERLRNPPVELNIVLRSAGILACAFCLFWPDSHVPKAEIIAEICYIPKQAILAFSSILFNELILR